MEKLEDRVSIAENRILSDDHYILRKVTFSWRRADGNWQPTAREVYDRGNGCAILLVNRARQTVVLTRQFRMPAFLNGYREMLLEAAAGVLDGADPAARVKAEAEEETGYSPKNVRQVFELFMSPGAVTEKLHLFVGDYDDAERGGRGGGIAEEGEDIEIVELPIREAMAMVAEGRICDAKTVILLQYAERHIFANAPP